MPQNHRSVAFSGKKKKDQMRAKKERKQLISSGMAGWHKPYEEQDDVYNEIEKKDGELGVLAKVETINARSNTAKNSNRYNLKFNKEKEEEVAARQAQHHQPVKLAQQHEKEITVEEFYPPGLDYPKRPAWNKNMNRQELDRSENRHFRLFCDKIDKEFKNGDMSLYELNLETWRQLWRVTEMSDILLVIVDARYPVAHFPPYLYHHLVKTANKGVILVLNKCDLIEPTAILAWTDYFNTYFPHLTVVPFSSLEGCKHRRGLLRMATESSLRLVEACQRLVDEEVDLTPWQQKIKKEQEEEETLTPNEGGEERHQNVTKVKSMSTAPSAYQRCQGGVLTLGTIGHPNAGKSSLINALMGKKVVSVSRTPGHTKHFQTIFLTETVKLCDCPGLVFPSRVARPLQVVLGSYPVAQVRDPIGVVAYMAGHLDIPSILKLKHSEENEEQVWTAYTICQAWAEKRGYHIRTKGGRPDVYRAANELLRMCLVGHRSLILSFVPPDYWKNKETYEKDERLEDVCRVQGIMAKKDEEKDLKPVSAGDIEDKGNEEENDDDYDDDDDGDSEEVSRDTDDNLCSEEEYGDDEDSESEIVHSRGKFALLMEED